MFHDHATAAAKLLHRRPLLVDGFDAEQVWVQINTAAPQLQRCTRKLFKGMSSTATLIDEATERDIDGKPHAGTHEFTCASKSQQAPKQGNIGELCD